MDKEPSGFTQAFMGILLLFLIGWFVSCTTDSGIKSPDDKQLEKMRESFEGVTVVEGVIKK